MPSPGRTVVSPAESRASNTLTQPLEEHKQCHLHLTFLTNGRPHPNISALWRRLGVCVGWGSIEESHYHLLLTAAVLASQTVPNEQLANPMIQRGIRQPDRCGFREVEQRGELLARLGVSHSCSGGHGDLMIVLQGQTMNRATVNAQCMKAQKNMRVEKCLSTRMVQRYVKFPNFVFNRKSKKTTLSPFKALQKVSNFVKDLKKFGKVCKLGSKIIVYIC